MEEKLKELLDIRDYFVELSSTRDGVGELGKAGTIVNTIRDIFTSTLTTKITEVALHKNYGGIENMQRLPSAYGGEENVNKFVRAKEIALEWVAYKDALLNNASTKAYITVALDNTSNVVITLTDPYADL